MKKGRKILKACQININKKGFEKKLDKIWKKSNKRKLTDYVL